MTRFVDLSHTIEHGIITYLGLPAPVICDFLSREASRRHYAPDTEFHIGRIDMVANTGTYIDAPFHRYADGVDVAGLAIDGLANLDTVVVRAPYEHGRSIDASFFEDLEVQGRAVLVHTGWSRHWGSETYFEGHPFLMREAAWLLRERGARLVGIDSLNIDDTEDGERPVHSVLLKNGVPIVEHMTGLDSVPGTGARLFAVPPKVRGMGTFPVRVFCAI